MSTRVKNPQEIAKVRELVAEGNSLKSVARKLKYSINTIRKIIRNPHIKEFPKIVKKFHYKKIVNKNGKDYISPIDQEKLRIYKNNEGYWRTTYRNKNNESKRDLLHIHEAKKLITPWGENSVVHHIDMDKSNIDLSNLSVFKSQSEHAGHHDIMEKAMYEYLKDNNLLNDFYLKYPQLNLSSLQDLASKESQLTTHLSS